MLNSRFFSEFPPTKLPFFLRLHERRQRRAMKRRLGRSVISTRGDLWLQLTRARQPLGCFYFKWLPAVEGICKGLILKAAEGLEGPRWHFYFRLSPLHFLGLKSEHTVRLSLVFSAAMVRNYSNYVSTKLLLGFYFVDEAVWPTGDREERGRNEYCMNI